MGADVVVLVTCTNRKTLSPPSALMLRTVRGRTPAARAAAWLDRLQSAEVEHVPAESLYAGDHWQVVRAMRDDATRAGRRVCVWVCSAGYGLIPLGADIAPYGATFAPNHPDSVTRGQDNGRAGAARREWWRTLAGWSGPAPGSPRTIVDLVSGLKNRSLLVAASPQYLDAAADDLALAASALGPERVAVFCAGLDSHPILDPYVVPCDARLQKALGGALNSLNARCVRSALPQTGEDGVRLTVLRRRFSRLLSAQPQRTTPKRTPLSDDEVRAFIMKALREDATLRPTPLLDRLRRRGLACEQARFCALFRRAEGGRRG